MLHVHGPHLSFRLMDAAFSWEARASCLSSGGVCRFQFRMSTWFFMITG